MKNDSENQQDSSRDDSRNDHNGDTKLPESADSSEPSLSIPPPVEEEEQKAQEHRQGAEAHLGAEGEVEQSEDAEFGAELEVEGEAHREEAPIAEAVAATRGEKQEEDQGFEVEASLEEEAPSLVVARAVAALRGQKSLAGTENPNSESLDEESEDGESAPGVLKLRRKVFGPLSSFEEAGLEEPIMKALGVLGWTKPSVIQSLSLPYTLAGRDVAGFAQTGTGKTGVFLLTLIDRWMKDKKSEAAGESSKKNQAHHAYALVLCPTRELAIQIAEDYKKLFPDNPLKACAIYGGENWEGQAQELRQGVDLILATPGRLRDFHSKQLIDFSTLKLFVCDEVDRMFDMGFIEDAEFVFEKLGEHTQKLLFSATSNERVKELAFKFLDHPEYITANPENLMPELMEQHAILCETPNKFKVLLGFLKEHEPVCAIVFTNTKLTASWLHYKLRHNGIESDLITGDLPQPKRIKLIQKIKQGQVKVLIATDVASRGIHISDVTHVYNFDLPDESANYVHRVGRTARAGEKGSSFSLVCEEYGENLEGIQKLLGDKAPKPVWHKKEYLDVVDQAGNPFAEGVLEISRDVRPNLRKGREMGPSKENFGNARTGARPSDGRSDRSPPRRDSRPPVRDQERSRDQRPSRPNYDGNRHDGHRDRQAYNDRRPDLRDRQMPQGRPPRKQGQVEGSRIRPGAPRDNNRKPYVRQGHGHQQPRREAAPAQQKGFLGFMKKIFSFFMPKK